jgi:hypothetical protein
MMANRPMCCSGVRWLVGNTVGIRPAELTVVVKPMVSRVDFFPQVRKSGSGDDEVSAFSFDGGARSARQPSLCNSRGQISGMDRFAFLLMHLWLLFGVTAALIYPFSSGGRDSRNIEEHPTRLIRQGNKVSHTPKSL